MNAAERLIDIADEVLARSDRLFIVEGPLPPNAVDVTALAIRLRRRPDLALRAMVEEWSGLRIVRELY